MEGEPKGRKTWKRIMLVRHAMMERLGQQTTPGDGDYFIVRRSDIELLAFKVRGRRGVFFVPINNQLWVPSFIEVMTVSARNVQTTLREADNHNTSLFTCRECGVWLEPYRNNGYGTLDGQCGCKERKEEQKSC